MFCFSAINFILEEFFITKLILYLLFDMANINFFKHLRLNNFFKTRLVKIIKEKLHS